MLRPNRLFVVAVVVAASVAAPTAASAGTVTVTAPCFASGSQVGFGISGFAPGLVDLQIDGSYLDSVDTGDSGAFTGTFPAPGVGTHTLSAAAGGSASFAVTDTGATQTPSAPKPSGKVKLVAHGFIGAKALYAHYVFHPTQTSYQAKKHVRLGAATGACGGLTKKVAALPVKKPKAGVWIVQVDARPTYKKQLAPYAELSVYVPKK